MTRAEVTLAATIRARFEAGRDRPLVMTGEHEFLERTPVAAAVLVAITDRVEPGLILTRRNDDLRNHPGQIAFAGGRADPGDAGPVETALREAQEEIGMPPGQVEIVAHDAPYVTYSGFDICPVVGIVPPDLPLVPLEHEVADIFEVPLAFATDPANQVRQEADILGRRRHYYEIVWGERRIWGVTAALIVNLSRWLRG